MSAFYKNRELRSVRGRQRLAYWLWLSGLSQREIARIWRISIPRVWQLVGRGRRLAGQALGRHERLWIAQARSVGLDIPERP